MRFFGSLGVFLALAILGAESNKKILLFHSLASLLSCDIFPGWSLNKREPDYPSDEDIAEYLAMVRDGYRIPYSGPQQMEIGESQGFEAVMRSNSLILGVGKHMICSTDRRTRLN